MFWRTLGLVLACAFVPALLYYARRPDDDA